MPQWVAECGPALQDFRIDRHVRRDPIERDLCARMRAWRPLSGIFYDALLFILFHATRNEGRFAHLRIEHLQHRTCGLDSFRAGHHSGLVTRVVLNFGGQRPDEL